MSTYRRYNKRKGDAIEKKMLPELDRIFHENKNSGAVKPKVKTEGTYECLQWATSPGTKVRTIVTLVPAEQGR